MTTTYQINVDGEPVATMTANFAEAEPVFAAYIDGIIWGIGNSEESAIADGTDWLSRNGDIEDAQYLKADQCDQDLADAVTNRGGQVQWEWAQHPGHRHMQLRGQKYEIIGGDYGPERVVFDSMESAEESLAHLQSEFPDADWSISIAQ